MSRPDYSLLVADRSLARSGDAPPCPRCRRNDADPILLGTEREGNICASCWQADREAVGEQPPMPWDA
jgi:hypothetical protein